MSELPSTEVIERRWTLLRTLAWVFLASTPPLPWLLRYLEGMLTTLEIVVLGSMIATIATVALITVLSEFLQTDKRNLTRTGIVALAVVLAGNSITSLLGLSLGLADSAIGVLVGSLLGATVALGVLVLHRQMIERPLRALSND